jgi:UDPglucose 6-dehydrogenase
MDWAFKNGTNDSRESAAIYIADYLLNQQAEITVYDPKVIVEQVYSDLDNLGTSSIEDNRRLLKVVDEPQEAVYQSHAIAILSEWEEFKNLNWSLIHEKMLKLVFVFDGR